MTAELKPSNSTEAKSERRIKDKNLGRYINKLM
jgi:hypothetical protein